MCLDFPVASVSLYTIINAGSESDKEATANGSLPAAIKCQMTAQGESTFENGAVSQYGVSTIRPCPPAGSDESPGPVSELTECGVAHLPLTALSQVQSQSPETPPSPLQHLQLLVRIDKATGAGFKVICNLLWKGEVTNETIQRIEDIRTSLTWETLVAWKAWGQPRE